MEEGKQGKGKQDEKRAELKDGIGGSIGKLPPSSG
jgi:hypothetical protein